MPLSDDLYFAEESDHESFSDELSPVDGYFNRGERPNAMLQDPSIREDSKEPEAKTLLPPHLLERMGRGSRISNPSPSLPSQSYASPPLSNSNSFPSRGSNTPISPASSRRLDDLFPRRALPVSMNAPPPAYSATPESTTSSPQEPTLQQPTPPQIPPPLQWTYSTFSEQHLERGLLPAREPENMGSPEEADESTPLSMPVARKPERHSCRRFFRHLLLIALVLTVTTTLLTTLIHGLKSSSPDIDISPPGMPKSPDPPSVERPIDSSGPYCASATYRKNLTTYKFPTGHDLTVFQTAYDEDDGRNSVQTAGEIRLRRLPKDLRSNQAYFTVDVYVSDPDLDVETSWDHETKVLKVSTPNSVRVAGNMRACVSVEITAWFPEDAELVSLSIRSIQLTLRVVEDIKIKVENSQFITEVGRVVFPRRDLFGWPNRLSNWSEGSISTGLDGISHAQTAHPFSSRRILVESKTGSVSGCYPLLDYLGIASYSGSVKVSVIPQDVLPAAPAPAELDVGTTSSSIQVDVPVRDGTLSSYVPPARNYITRVHAGSGSIRGCFILGSMSSFRSAAGHVQLIGMPVIQAESSANTFETNTGSGSIRVGILDPIFIKLVSSEDERPEQQPHRAPFRKIGDDDPYIVIPPLMNSGLFKVEAPESTMATPLRNLRSTHTSRTSSVQVKYPAAWEGNLHAKTVSGSIKVEGKGLSIDHRNKGHAGDEVWASKGVNGDGEGSAVEMSGRSGSLKFSVGTMV